ncbi:MAG: peroxiredoxin [Gammaproteobacteria bacterium]
MNDRTEKHVANDESTRSGSAQIDDAAPDFVARTTRGEVQLSDFRGRWLVFFSHPADFTPVCTSEFVAVERARSRFEDLNCSLLGLSVDSLYAHIAWVKDIEARFDVKISFPIVEDISMTISRAYGMIHESSATTAAVRSVFFIDPEGIIRALLHYPMNIGRSVEELLRVLQALQLTDDAQLATPEGWQPGDDAVLPPPLDISEADKRSATEGHAWYLTEAQVVQ